MNQKFKDHGLTLFYNITISDPLFAAEGLDLDNAQWALDAIETATNNLEKIWKENYFRYKFFFLLYPFSKTLHPISFLKKFIKCERARRYFLKFPTIKNADILLKNYKETVAALQEDAKMHQTAFGAILKLDTNNTDTVTYYFFKNMITLDEIMESTDAIINNTYTLKKEIKRREDILSGHFGDRICSSPIIRIDKIPHKDNIPTLSKELYYMLSLLEQKFVGKFKYDEKHGPIYYQLSNFDNELKYHQFFVYLSNSQESSGKNILRVLLADEHFFLPLDKEKYSFHFGQYLYKPLIDRGILYWYQTATNFYCTRDLSYYSDLLTLIDLKRRKFLNTTYVLSQKSSMLDFLLWQGRNEDFMFIKQAKILALDKKLPSPLYMFIARSYPSLYYLSFNRSVWRQENKLEFLGTRFIGEGSPYKSYKEIASTISKEDLKKILQASRMRAKEWNIILNKIKS